MGIEKPATQFVWCEGDDHGIGLVDERATLAFEQGTGVGSPSPGPRADHDAGPGLLSGARSVP